MTFLPWLFAMLLAQSGAAPATTPSPADELARHVRVTLSIRDGKTVFRSGEPIRLIASFTADRPGYQVDTVFEKFARAEDQILITPEKGVLFWRELASMPDTYHRDYGSSSNLSAQPVDMTLPLNLWLRFDEPGEYTVRVRTRRVSFGNLRGLQAPWLTTNDVTFKVVPMTEREEDVEAQRLSALLDTPSQNDLTKTERCEDLAFLIGDAGTREKVRRYLQPKYLSSELGVGLYISRSTPLVVSLLETDMRDPTKPVEHIIEIANLRLWMEMPALVAEAQGDMDMLRGRKRARLDAIRGEYINEAIASLSVRTGSARRDTAASLLSLLRSYGGVQNPTATPTPLPPAVRTIVVDEFGEFDPTTQAALVQTRWKDIRDPKLLPALEKMARSTDPWVRGMPMAAILEIAPDRAKPIFISEMLGPRPVNSEAFLQLRDETLPEMDRPLIEQIGGLAASPNSRDQFELRTKAKFMARYASAAILSDVQGLYETRGAKLEQEIRVDVLTYLARWDEAGAAERLDRALAAESDDALLLYRLANARYSKSVDAALRVRMESADPRTVEEAASLLSQHGPSDARAVLESRLSRWMNEWSGRAAELEPDPKTTTPQARLQISLIRAILNGKAWKVSEADATRLKQSCVTESCRKAFAAR